MTKLHFGHLSNQNLKIIFFIELLISTRKKQSLFSVLCNSYKLSQRFLGNRPFHLRLSARKDSVIYRGGSKRAREEMEFINSIVIEALKIKFPDNSEPFSLTFA